MSDPALELPINYLTVEGLEHVFEPGDNGGDLSPGDSTPPGDQPADIWTVDDAIRHLGVTRRTILRKLKNGELVGYKVPGPFGQEWRIHPVDKGGDFTGDLAPPSLSSGDQPVSPPDSGLVDEFRRQILELKTENQTLQKELQGAHWRNGYLESQMLEREKEIKLLTDSQRKVGMWRRICKWLAGGPGA